ncbi:rCG59744 [Rattus norvegicus]|uniref:RCG59744 n=1 Tax=Rattus norvegicus TaxID=10116 RepID=A6HQP5_RAT|nr:rCG59744 [Rattus norvegicus]
MLIKKPLPGAVSSL